MRYLIPIAAGEDLFPRSEFHFPKSLVEIRGQTMISHVIEGIRRRDSEARFIFVVKKRDCDEFSLNRTIELCADGKATVVILNTETRGAICSCLLAVDHIDDDDPLVICNGDQVIDTELSEVYSIFERADADAGVITFPSVHPRWSYVRTGSGNSVLETAEKRVLSKRAIAGFYYFRRGSDFVAAAQSSIINGESFSGPFFLSPTLNEIILRGGNVRYYDINEKDYHSIYSPLRLEAYERSLNSQKDTVKQQSRPQFVIPMAGLGSRFSEAGYTKPKPFIDVLGKPMISRVIDNLHQPDARYVLIAREKHLAMEAETVAQMEAKGHICFVPINLVTEGAACTVLFARRVLDSEQPIVIANCDQIVDFDCEDFIRDAQQRNLDGSILVFRNLERDPKWSFARLDERGMVTEVREKEAISDLATVGIYYFKSAKILYQAALDMISVNDRVNGEFYICPLYNYLIKDNLSVGVYEVKSEAMHGIGTPSDLDAYVRLIE